MRRLATLGLLLASIVLALSVAAFFTRSRELTVRGVLVDVRATSIVQAEQVTLRADDGRLWTFRVAPEVMTNSEHPQSASHLRQHMMLGEPMLVHYRETREGPVAVRIVDDTPAGDPEP